MLPSIRIATYSKIVAFCLLLAVSSAVTFSLISYNNAQNVETNWKKFQKNTAQKALLLSHIRALLGYNGMIHHFKNFVLRGDRQNIISMQKNLLELSVALTAYQSLGLDVKEQKSFQTLLITVEEYKKRARIVELLLIKGRTSVEIDAMVKIDDTAAINALEILESKVTVFYRQNSEIVTSAVQKITLVAKVFGAGLVVLLLALSTLTIWFTNWHLIRPLNSLVSAFKRVNPHNPGNTRLPINDSWGETELSSLARSGNEYIAAVHEHALSRQSAEAELKDNEEHLRTVVENAVDAIITINNKGIITSFNTAAQSLFNYDENEVLGENVSILMPEPFQSMHDQYLKNYEDTKISKIIGMGREVEGQRKDGTTFPLRLGVSETKTSKGVGFTGVIRDLSAQKDTDARLQMAKEAAEKANQAKSEFLSSMSHELRTPMNAINGFTQLMLTSKKYPPTQRQAGNLELILKSGNHLLELITQVLELSKIETGHIDVNLTKVDPFTLIDECVTSQSMHALKTSITLENRCDMDTGIIITSDAMRLRQILFNFISNAIKYNKPDGHIFVDFRITSRNMLRINVHDTGHGIPQDKQKSMFQPFNRLGKENGDIEGTGIGLTISQRIAEALNANIGFVSQEGQGSTFWIDLPIGSNS